MNNALDVRSEQRWRIQLEQRNDRLFFIDQLGSFDHVIPTLVRIAGIRRLGSRDQLVVLGI